MFFDEDMGYPEIQSASEAQILKFIQYWFWAQKGNIEQVYADINFGTSEILFKE